MSLLEIFLQISATVAAGLIVAAIVYMVRLIINSPNEFEKLADRCTAFLLKVMFIGIVHDIGWVHHAFLQTGELGFPNGGYNSFFPIWFNVLMAPLLALQIAAAWSISSRNR